jgi:type IV secretory pathway VirB10-like protein
MSKLRFSDGITVSTDGPYRRLRLPDGLYVVGRGTLVPCADEAEVESTLAELERAGAGAVR